MVTVVNTDSALERAGGREVREASATTVGGCHGRDFVASTQLRDERAC